MASFVCSLGGEGGGQHCYLVDLVRCGAMYGTRLHTLKYK